MGKNIFESWAQRYFEAGIPVIPLNGKIPLVRDWQEWSKRAQTEEEIESLIARFPNANIGAVLGLWASAIDVDTDSVEVLSALPFSPFRRRGKKGVVILCERNSHESKSPAGFPVEFLNHGRQIVLPPSVHPETGAPYVWELDTDILHWGAETLPAYHPSLLDNIVATCQRVKEARPSRASRFNGDSPVLLSNMGRNNKLTAIAYAKACDSVSVDEAVKGLLAFDKKEHLPPWFEDPSEPHHGKNPTKTARAMYERAVKKATGLGHVRPVVNLTLNLTSPSPGDAWTPYPRPRGILAAFVDYCQLTSTGAQDALGLGGALAFLSTLISNRFYTEAYPYKIYPNNYIINLGYSGFGKEVPQRVIHELLANSGLLGSSNYKSGTSIVMHLPEQQERIDLLDECSQFLKSMTSKEDYKSEIVEVLSGLYTKSDSRFIGIASRADGMQFGACWNPCVTLLGSTTPNGFRGSVNRDMSAKGLMPRFLIFYQKHIGAYRINTDTVRAEALLSSLKSFTSAMLSCAKSIHPDHVEDLAGTDKSKRYEPVNIPMTEAALREWQLLALHYFEEGSRDPEGFRSAFKNRFAQHIGKLALVDAVGQSLGEISIDSIEWAHAVVEAQWANVQELYELATARNENEKNLLECRAMIDAAGIMTKSEFTKKTQWLYNNQRTDILKALETMEAVKLVTQKVEGHLGRAPVIILSTRSSKAMGLLSKPS